MIFIPLKNSLAGIPDRSNPSDNLIHVMKPLIPWSETVFINNQFKSWGMTMNPDYKGTIEHSGQLLDEWVQQVNHELGWRDLNRSFRLLRITLNELRDMLQIDEAAQLSAQLPLVIRGYYFEGWNPSKIHTTSHSKADFVRKIGQNFSEAECQDVEKAITAVFSVLNKHVSSGEIEDVRGSLREKVRELWPVPLSG